MSEQNKCPICGEPTYLVYGKHPRKDGLCWKHSQALFNKNIEQCPDCKKWHDTDKDCDCKKPKTPPKKVQKEEPLNQNVEMIIKVENEEETAEVKRELKIGRCLTCSHTTKNDYLFCTTCYNKYKDKTLLLQVDKMLTITLKDESYEGILECDDGHVVKSICEREIDDYLYQKGIKHSYEPLYDAGNDKKPIKPDFLLPDYLGENEDVIIEYWGFDESHQEYTKRKNYKLNIYKEQKATVICFSAKNDLRNIKFALKKKLKHENIKIHEINE